VVHIFHVEGEHLQR